MYVIAHRKSAAKTVVPVVISRWVIRNMLLQHVPQALFIKDIGSVLGIAFGLGLG